MNTHILVLFYWIVGQITVLTRLRIIYQNLVQSLANGFKGYGQAFNIFYSLYVIKENDIWKKNSSGVPLFVLQNHVLHGSMFTDIKLTPNVPHAHKRAYGSLPSSHRSLLCQLNCVDQISMHEWFYLVCIPISPVVALHLTSLFINKELRELNFAHDKPGTQTKIKEHTKD